MSHLRSCGLVACCGLAGCLFGTTPSSTEGKALALQVQTSEHEAAAKKDYATIIGYDDLFVARHLDWQLVDEHTSNQRKQHFTQWLDAALQQVGPPSATTLEAVWGVLSAFRKEARRPVEPLWVKEMNQKSFEIREQGAKWTLQYLRQRDLQDKRAATANDEWEGGASLSDLPQKSDDDYKYEVEIMMGKMPTDMDESTKERLEDFGEIDNKIIAPRFEQLASPMWAAAEAKEKAGDGVRAVQLGLAVITELPKGTPYTAKLAELSHRVGNGFLDRAKAFSDATPGARVLHAKLAASLNVAPGPVATPSPELLEETGIAWKIEAPSECGGYIDGDKEKHTLEQELRSIGWVAATTPNAPFLRVKIETCPFVDQQTDSQDDVPYTTTEQRTDLVDTYDTQCTEGKRHSTVERDDSWITTREWKDPDTCSDVKTGTKSVSRDVTVHHSETVLVHHHLVTQELKGTIEMWVTDPKTSQLVQLTWPVDVSGTSNDDPEFQGVNVHHEREGWTEVESTQRASDKLIDQIKQHRLDMYAARALEKVAQGKAAAAAGNAAEADDAFYIAEQMATAPGATPNISNEMSEWMSTTYHVTPDVLTAALADQRVPRANLVAGHEVAALEIPLHRTDLEKIFGGAGQLISRQASVLFAGGVTRTETSTKTSTGGLFDMSVNVTAKPDMEKLFGFRLALGGLGTGGGHMFVDSDLMVGYGIHPHGFWLGPIVGLGGDFTTGSQDAPLSADNFTIRPGFIAEYGARLSYTFPRNGKIELFYDKGFRSTDVLACEKRGEIRFFDSGLALVFRYTEYLGDVDNFYSPFSSTNRAAKTAWFILGFGS